MPPGDDVEPINNFLQRQQLVKVKSRPLRRRCHRPSRFCRCHHRLPLCCLLSAVAHCHCDCAAIPPSIVLLPLLPIKIVLPPSPSPIAAASIYGYCHHDHVTIPLPVEPPPLLPNGIMLPLLPSLFVTPAVTHCHHCRPSQSCHRPAVHGAVAAVTYCLKALLQYSVLWDFKSWFSFDANHFYFKLEQSSQL